MSKKLIVNKIISNTSLYENKSHGISMRLIKWNIFNQCNYKQDNDVTMLSNLNISIITQLRSNHIKLNGIMHQLQHIILYKKQIKLHQEMRYYMQCNLSCCESNNSGRCSFCVNKIEDAYHFIMECKHYKKNRFKLYCECMQIFIKYQMNFSLKNMLFPPLNMSQQHREHIFDLLCQYVIDSKGIYFSIYC